MSTYTAGRHFLQIPGPTNLPDRVARALSRPTIDHRGPECARLTLRILERLQQVFQTSGPVIVYPSSGSGAWEAALVNTLSPGDRVLFGANGQFAAGWTKVATGLGLTVEELQGDWRCPVDLSALESRLAADRGREIQAVALVHNETSTGVVNDVAGARAALDRTGHDALLLVDVVSSLGAMDYRHDDWGVDVTLAGSQKGLMMPPGLGFNAASSKALAAAETARLPRSYWSWGPVLEFNRRGFYPYTRPRIYSSAWMRRCRCCLRKGCRKYSPGTSVWRRRRGGRCEAGDWRYTAGTPMPIPRPSPRWRCRQATTPTNCAASSLSGSICRWVLVWGS